MRKAFLLLVLASVGCDTPQPLAPSRAESLPRGDDSLGAVAGGAAKAQATIRVLCFGDSLTYGTTLREAPGLASLSSIDGYVPKLARLLKSELGDKLKFHLVNSGIGGETTAEGLARLPGELRIYDPQLVLLWMGVVDVDTKDDAHFTQVRANLNAMMQIIKDYGAQVVIGTLPPLDPDGFRALAPENIPRLNTIIRQEANRLQVPVAGHEVAFGKNPVGLLGPDGLHPNDNGYELVAQTWFDVIRKLKF
jgi:lysophospholipase L1-like esterase